MFACLHLTDAPDPHVSGGVSCLLLEIAEALGPDVEIHRPDTVIVDLSGRRAPVVADPSVPGLELAVAATPDLALLGTLVGLPFCGRPLVVEDFDPVSIEWLESGVVSGGESLLPLFRLWGLRTFGDVRRLPRQQTAERAGPAALWLHDVLHGRRCRPLNLHRPPERHVMATGFEHPVGTSDALVFQVRRALQALCDGLHARHRAAGNIRIRLVFESGDPFERTILLPEPLCSPEALSRPLEQVLETLRAPAGILGLELELAPVAAAGNQRGLWGRQLRQPARWPDTLARLEGLLGEGRVGVPQPESSHRPDAFRMTASASARPLHDAMVQLPAVSVPLRRFRPPQVVAVAFFQQGNHPSPQALLTGPHVGRITGLRGPFPVSGDWWDGPNAWRRVEWDIAMESRYLLRLAYLPPDRWVLDGVYG
jgi:protein ImuB